MFKIPFALAFSNFLLLVPLWGAGEIADYLILENHASLEILNRYEQPLTPDEKKEFLPFAPLKIVAEKTLLGDGITSAMEVSHEGMAYYLLAEANADSSFGMRRYRDCRTVDGREMAARAEIRCTRGAGPGGRTRKIRAGEAVRSIFTFRSHSYVKIPGAEAEFAWCPSQGLISKKMAGEKATAAPETGLDPALQSILEARMQSANEAYESYTRAFNKLTGESRPPPRWECFFSRDGMNCRLQGDMRYGDLANSTAVLVEELRNSMTGRPFEVTYGKDGLRISPRSGKHPSRP